MNVETLEDLFGFQLQHAYYAERTHFELLSEMAEAAPTDDLCDVLADHRAETDEQIGRLEDVFAAIGRRPQASRTRTIDGLIESWREHRSTTGDGPAVPSALEIALTAERLEIRAYESLLTLAGRLAYADDVVEPLETTLAEERAAVDALEEVETETSILDAVAVNDR